MPRIYTLSLYDAVVKLADLSGKLFKSENTSLRRQVVSALAEYGARRALDIEYSKAQGVPLRIERLIEDGYAYLDKEEQAKELSNGKIQNMPGLRQQP